MGGGGFSSADHLQTLWEERHGGQKDREVANKTKLKGLFRDLKGTDRRKGPKSQVPVLSYTVLQFQVQYCLLRNIGISYAHVKTFPP